MKKGNFWALGVLFGSIFAYTGWNGFETPEILMGKTNVTSGRIIEIFPNSEIQNPRRRIKYAYPVDKKFYVGFKKLGTKDDRQAIGNDVQVIYSVKNPERHKVEILPTKYSDSKGIRYYSNKKDGFIELLFINGIFRLKEYASKGKLIGDFVGEFYVKSDTIKFLNYAFEKSSSSSNEPEIFVFDSDNDTQLLDIKTKRVFKVVN